MAQVAGLQDFRREGPPGDIGTFQSAASIIIFPFTFSGVTYYVAQRMGVRGWTLLSQGTLAAPVIQAALNLSSVDILLKTGIYDVQVTLYIRGVSDVVLRGEGWGTKLWTNNTMGIRIGTEDDSLTSQRIIIRDLYLDLSRTTYTDAPHTKEAIIIDGNNTALTTDITIRDCYFYRDNSVSTIHGYNNQGRVLVTDSYFYQCTATSGAIHPHNGGDWIAAGNHLISGTGEAIKHPGIIINNSITNYTVTVDQLRAAIVSGRVIAGNVITGGTGPGILIFTTEVIVANNRISGLMNGDGIKTRADAAGSQSVIMGNNIYNAPTNYRAIEVLSPSHNVLVIGNLASECSDQPIYVSGNDCEVISNHLYRPANGTNNTRNGIYVSGDRAIVSGNKLFGDQNKPLYGILLTGSDGSMVTDNHLKFSTAGGATTGTADIHLENCNKCLVSDNHIIDDQVVSGILVSGNSARNIVRGNVIDVDGIGVSLAAATVTGTVVKDNPFMDTTGIYLSDLGVNTILEAKIFQFTEPLGTATYIVVSPVGIEVDAADEGALACGEAPLDVQQVIRFRVKGVGLAAPGAAKGMLLQILINAGKPAGHEAYNAEAITVAGVISTEDNFAINDAVEWFIDATDDADVGDIKEGETIEMFAMFEDDGANGDIATDAILRTISMEYV